MRKKVWARCEPRRLGAREQGDTKECGYKGAVVTVVLAIVDCCEATQKNEACFVHLYWDLRGSFSEESLEPNRI